MWYWNSDKIDVCMQLLQDSRKRILNLSAKCAETAEFDNSWPEGRKCLREAEERLIRTAKWEQQILECLQRIDAIYCKNETLIADYFDLEIQEIPKPKLGISTFKSLETHEGLMPFRKEGL